MPKSPQVGYNHNIPHRGRLYHVQTEDSGLKKAHIFTHVFFDGTIVASNKVDYESRLEAADLEKNIILLMQGSHKTMIRRLRKGEFDEKIEKYIGVHPDLIAASTPSTNKAGNNEQEQESPNNETCSPPSRQPAVEQSGPPVPVSVPDALSQPMVLQRRIPEPRPVTPMGRPLRTGKPGPAIDPTMMHPSMSSQPARAQLGKIQSNGNPKEGQVARGPARGKRRVLAGIGGPGSKPLTSAALIHQRDMIIGKFGTDYDRPIDEEVSRLVRDDT